MKLFYSRISEKQLRQYAAIASVLTAITLLIIKAAAAFFTGSLAILSSAVDSLTDILASLVTWLTVIYADKPLTNRHRFGYGKAESISALIQTAFIAGSAGFILFDAFRRLTSNVTLNHTLTGIYVMFICLFLTMLLVVFQRYILSQTHSLAIKSDSLHYVTDTVTNIGVIISLLAVHYLRWTWCDIFIAVLTAAYLLYNAWIMANEAFDEITDKEISEELRQKIIQQVLQIKEIKGYHDLRTRLSGNRLFIEIHLEFDGNLSLFNTHALTELAEKNIEKVFPNAQTIIHQDPYGIKEKRIDHDINGNCQL